MLRILWAEDDFEQYELYSGILEHFLGARGLQYELLRAVDGNEVYRYLTPRATVDLLVLDIQMPNFGGLQAARDIGAKFEGIPILVVSGNIQKQEVANELEALRSAGLITGYLHSDDVDGWCEAIERIMESDPISILHMSDIHFGRFHGLREVNVPLEKLICAQLEPLIEPAKIDLLAVSGDFCSEGLAVEFQQAIDFLELIAGCFGVSRDKVILVPGNHDIYRREEEERRFRKFIEFLNLFYATSPTTLARYGDLYNSQTGRLREEGVLGDSLYSLSVYDDLRLVVVGLNSVVSIEERWNHGDISGAQLIKVETELARIRVPRSEYFRMAVFHHHLFEVPSIYSTDDQERVVSNQGLILRHFIRHGIRLVLHGHSHYAAGYKYQPFFFDDTRREPILVFSTGTLSGSHRSTAQYSYQCNLLRLIREERSISRGVVTPFRLMDDALEWRALPRIEFDLVP